jgi:hypothetical protein
MSFPSVATVAAERGISLTAISTQEAQEILLEAVKRDCPQAVAYLHARAHEAQEKSSAVFWSEDPNSKLGKQLIRIHASDAVRPLIEKHICHGKHLTFVNCCNGQVGGPKPDKEELLRLQIECQAGPLAYADC